MSKFETMLKEGTKKPNIAQVTNESGAISLSLHAKRELNYNKTHQKSLAETVASEYLMEGTKQMIEYANIYKDSFNEMVNLQTVLVDTAKTMSQKSKDYSNQVGEALARIDKVLVKDFENKLLLLERFVVASKEIAELEKSGMLSKISSSFNK
jgi:hypothetical protein